MRLLKTVLFIFLILNLIPAQTAVIKFATIAPEGSTWMQLMREFNDDVMQATNNGVKFKIYSGAVQGDEKDVLRKIRINQLHSAGFTGVGLGEILPEVRVLDTPFLFKNKAEVDYIADKFFTRFAAAFEKKGFVLLGWAEVGWAYVFTRQPVQTVADFKQIKMWMWEGDPLAEETFRAFNVSAIPLSITDVSTSLQTGLIDGVYSPPLACIALQWFKNIKYMLNVPLANSNGAVLISKRMFDKLTPRQQAILRDKGRTYFNRLTHLSRQDNEKSKEQMLKSGVEKININDSRTLQDFDRTGERIRQALIGRLYDKDLLQSIEQELAAFREKQKSDGE